MTPHSRIASGPQRWSSSTLGDLVLSDEVDGDGDADHRRHGQAQKDNLVSSGSSVDIAALRGSGAGPVRGPSCPGSSRSGGRPGEGAQEACAPGLGLLPCSAVGDMPDSGYRCPGTPKSPRRRRGRRAQATVVVRQIPRALSSAG